MNILFSPFDALGLPVDEHDARAVHRAYKRACNARHSDKQAGQQSDYRWPQIHHLVQARDALLHDVGAAFERFKGYPRTFFPGQSPVFRDPVYLSDSIPHFYQCEECHMVLQHDDYDLHLEDHDKVRCRSCSDHAVMQRALYEEHLSTKHDLVECPHCSPTRMIRSRDIDGHTGRRHQCPLCWYQSGQADLLSHLTQEHAFVSCGRCKTGSQAFLPHVAEGHRAVKCLCGATICAESFVSHMERKHQLALCERCPVRGGSQAEWESHLRASHPFFRCPVACCSWLSMDSGCLNSHMLLDHELRPCNRCCVGCLDNSCDVHPGQASVQMDHIRREHRWVSCGLHADDPLCSVRISEEALSAHRRRRHKWLLCGVCGDALPDQEELDGHRQDHLSCPKCLCLQPSDGVLEQHLSAVHHLVRCQVLRCGELLSPGQLPDHFQMSHNRTQACPVPGCEELQSDSSTPYHLVQDHHYVRCAFCGILVSPADTLGHELVHDVRPCPDCDERFPRSDLQAHRFQSHHLYQCPFCEELWPLVIFKSHVGACGHPTPENGLLQYVSLSSGMSSDGSVTTPVLSTPIPAEMSAQLVVIPLVDEPGLPHTSSVMSVTTPALCGLEQAWSCVKLQLRVGSHDWSGIASSLCEVDMYLEQLKGGGIREIETSPSGPPTHTPSAVPTQPVSPQVSPTEMSRQSPSSLATVPAGSSAVVVPVPASESTSTPSAGAGGGSANKPVDRPDARPARRPGSVVLGEDGDVDPSHPPAVEGTQGGPAGTIVASTMASSASESRSTRRSTRAAAPAPSKSSGPAKRSLPSLQFERGRRSVSMDPLAKQLEDQVRGVDPLCKIPSCVGMSSDKFHVLKLVAVLWSRRAASSFYSLVDGRRHEDTVPHIPSSGIAAEISYHVNLIHLFERDSLLKNFYVRQSQIRLAVLVAEHTKKAGRTRADPQLIKQIRHSTGWDSGKLRVQCQTGRKWARLLGGYDGLQCFMCTDLSVFGVSSCHYLDLTNEDLALFHTLLDDPHTRSLCDAGKAFQTSLSARDDVEFMWESENRSMEDLSGLDDASLLSCLQPFPSPSENTYDPRDFETSAPPPDWPEGWSWPADPTGHGVDMHCSLCDVAECGCIEERSASRPRITQYGGSKRRGLRAVAWDNRPVAYAKGAIIGFLAGRIVPVGTHPDDVWALDFVRPDIIGQPTVCQIYMAEGGNLFRLLNHSHGPNAEFDQVLVSGRWRTAVRALEDIGNGVEIEVSYGPDYEVQGGCSCRVCCA